MPYGVLKVDTVTFTSSGVDKSVTLSGLVQNPTFSGTVTSTSTISGVTIQGGTLVSGATVTGSVGQFTSLTAGTVTLTSGVFASGTAAAPSVSIGTSTNGLYSPGADQLAISTAGTGRVFINSTGSLGVGAAAPASYKTYIKQAGTWGLVLEAASNDSRLLVGDVNSEFRFSASYAGTGTYRPLTFFTSDLERLRITSDGKVGIGTSSPDALLTVNGVGAFGAGSAAAPSIAITGDLNTGIYSPGADQLAISTAGTGRVFVASDGKVGIGATTPGYLIDGSNSSAPTLRLTDGVRHLLVVGGSTTQNPGIGTNYPGDLSFFTNGAVNERVRIDSSGRLLVGTSTARANFYNSTGTPKVQVESTSSDGSSLSLTTNFSTAVPSAGPNLLLARSGATSLGSNTLVAVNNTLGNIVFLGADGSEFVTAAQISAEVDGTPGANDMPGRLVFSTTADGASSPTERLRITSDGNVGVGTSSPLTNGYPAFTVSNNTQANLYFEDTGYEATGDGVGYFSWDNGALSFATASRSGTGTTGSNERVRIDSSGRLLVGTNTALTNIYTGATATTPQIQLSGAGLPESSLSLLRTGTTGATVFLNAGSSGNNVIADSITGRLIFNGYDGTNYRTNAQITAEVDGTPGANDMPGRLVFSTTADGASSPTERMRITSAGALRFGQTTTDYPGSGNTTTGAALTSGGRSGFSQSADFALLVNRNTSDGTVVQINREGNGVGSISVTTTATAFNTSSDYRLKENVISVTDGITRLQQLKPSRFNFIADPAKTVDGFIAHEVQAVVPEAITGEKDAVGADGNPIYQGIDQSKLVPLLTAALQEAVAKIESLEARLTAAGI